MRLIYFEGRRVKGSIVPNFGDHLNSWMWAKLLPGIWSPADGISFSGIGTIIDQALLPNTGKCVVFGSGVGYGLAPEGFGNSDWKILAVRGPLTAKVLGLDPGLAVTDAAIVLSDKALRLTLDTSPSPDTSNGIVFMPHLDSVHAGHWEDVCRAAGIQYLSPSADSKLTIQKIRSAKLVLADAMHAAIVADTFRIPWIPLSTSSHINTFKWLDWTLSMGLPYLPVSLPPTSSLEIFREHTLKLCGESFRVNPATADAAVRDFTIKRRISSSRYWKSYSSLSRKVLMTVPKRVYNAQRLAGLRSSDRKRYVGDAAKALYKAAQGTQYLSDESLFSLRAEQMIEKMQGITALARQWPA